MHRACDCAMELLYVMQLAADKLAVIVEASRLGAFGAHDAMYASQRRSGGG